MKQFYFLSFLSFLLSFSTAIAQQSCSFILHVDGVSGANTSECGSESEPCATINWGINRAFNNGYSDVRITANTTYNEIVDLAPGVNLWGGFDAQWAATGQTTIQGGLAGNGEFYTINANGINVPTVVSDLLIIAPSASGSGKSSYGIHMSVSDSITLQRVNINGGAGAPGNPGIAGANATTGAANGAPGGNADEFNTACNDDDEGAGGSGAVTPGYPNTAGGNGGQGGNMDDDCSGFLDLDATSGINGNNAIISTINSFGYRGAGGGTCNPGQNGNNGQTVHGTGGAGATGSANLVGFYWVSTNAADGTLGANGTGGGGGGGSGGCDSGTDSYGAGGGGGGSGGIASSAAGTGGVSGGNSAAIFMLSSTCWLIDCNFNLGIGGSGGNGGTSGTGTPGGTGGPGGLADGDSQSGGNGGDGGAGGNSGGGGGGAAGSAYGVWGNNSTVHTSNLSFNLGSAGTIGVGGSGTPTGAAGTDGNAGVVLNFGGNLTNIEEAIALEEDPCIEIITADVSVLELCAGETATIGYNAVGGFSGSNTFTAQLSDVNGGFGNPTDIGSVVSNTSGSITVAIPTDAASGSTYRIRVVSSATPAIGTVNPTDIIIHALPVVEANASETTVCAGNSVTLTGSGADLHTWNNPVLDGVAFVPTETSYYTVVGVDNATLCANTDSVLITVVELPDTTVIQNGNELAAVLSGASYQWLDCDNNYAIIPGAESQTYLAPNSGNFAVVVTGNGCADTSSCYNVIFVGLEDEVEEGNVLLLYPNPSAGVFQLISNVEQAMELSVFNTMGQIVYSQANFSNHSTMDLQGLNNGLYSVRFYNQDLNVVRQVVIQK
jgi:hypothetical protein